MCYCTAKVLGDKQMQLAAQNHGELLFSSQSEYYMPETTAYVILSTNK